MPSADPATLAPLIAFALWAVLLVILLGLARGQEVQRTKRAANTFKPIGDIDQLDAHSRAHMNTVENLPIFAVVYLSAIWLNASAPIVTLGWVIFGARVIQSVTHIVSRAEPAVGLRALMQVIQIVCFIWLGVSALMAA